MQKTYFLILSGEDRPGIMDTVASALARHGGNWLESRLAHLGSQFAGVVRFEIAADEIEPLQATIARDQPSDLALTIKPERESPAEDSRRRLNVSVLGLDRVGIVSRLVSALAAQGINVEDFRSDTESAAMSGERLFRAAITISIPEHGDPDALHDDLDAIAGELSLDLDLEG